MDTFFPSVIPMILLFLYAAVVGFGLWLILRFVRAVEQMGHALEDIAGTLKKGRDGSPGTSGEAPS